VINSPVEAFSPHQPTSYCSPKHKFLKKAVMFYLSEALSNQVGFVCGAEFIEMKVLTGVSIAITIFIKFDNFMHVFSKLSNKFFL